MSAAALLDLSRIPLLSFSGPVGEEADAEASASVSAWLTVWGQGEGSVFALIEEETQADGESDAGAPADRRNEPSSLLEGGFIYAHGQSHTPSQNSMIPRTLPEALAQPLAASAGDPAQPVIASTLPQGRVSDAAPTVDDVTTQQEGGYGGRFGWAVSGSPGDTAGDPERAIAAPAHSLSGRSATEWQGRQVSAQSSAVAQSVAGEPKPLFKIEERNEGMDAAHAEREELAFELRLVIPFDKGPVIAGRNDARNENVASAAILDSGVREPVEAREAGEDLTLRETASSDQSTHDESRNQGNQPDDSEKGRGDLGDRLGRGSDRSLSGQAVASSGDRLPASSPASGPAFDKLLANDEKPDEAALKGAETVRPPWVQKNSNSIQSVNVDLASEELGNVKVRIFGTQNSLRVQVTSPELEVRQRLQSAVDDLVARVTRSGVQVEELAEDPIAGHVISQERLGEPHSQDGLMPATTGAPSDWGDGAGRRQHRGTGLDWQEAVRRHRSFRRKQ